MNKKKKKGYCIIVWSYIGDFGGVQAYAPKWVCEWRPPKAGEDNWCKGHYSLTPKEDEAQTFGRDTALVVASKIRFYSGALATIEEA